MFSPSPEPAMDWNAMPTTWPATLKAGPPAQCRCTVASQKVEIDDQTAHHAVHCGEKGGWMEDGKGDGKGGGGVERKSIGTVYSMDFIGGRASVAVCSLVLGPPAWRQTGGLGFDAVSCGTV